jgi:hypothetical protein
VPRLTNERPLMNREDSWGASRNLAGLPGLRPWGGVPTWLKNKTGLILQPGWDPSFPLPLATWIYVNTVLTTVMIATTVQVLSVSGTGPSPLHIFSQLNKS